MRLIDQLQAMANIWAETNERSLSRLATIVVNDGHFFERIGRKRDCNTQTFEKFLIFFRVPGNWPDDSIPHAAAGLLDNFANIAMEAAASEGMDSGDAASASPDIALANIGEGQAA